MSSSGWSSDIDIDVNEINEEVAIREAKSCNQLVLLKGIEPVFSHKLKDLTSFAKAEKSFKLINSLSPQASLSTMPKTPKKYQKSKNLFEEKKTICVSGKEINDRFSKFKEKVKIKIEKLIKAQEDLQSKNCPFKPSINTKGSKRKFNEFLAETKKYEKRKFFKNIKTNKMTHIPVLCKHSTTLVNKNPEFSQPVHEKLYNERRVSRVNKRKKGNILPSFSPVVSPMANNIKRESLIENILYEDAIRRNNKRSQSPVYLKQKFISERSEKVLTEKFVFEFKKTVYDIFDEKDKFSYSEFLQILNSLWFTKNYDKDPDFLKEKILIGNAWNMIVGKEKKEAEKEEILNFLLAVMNYEHGSASKDIKKVHQKFINWYENRHLSILKNKKIKKEQEKEVCYTPNTLSLTINTETFIKNGNKEETFVKNKNLTKNCEFLIPESVKNQHTKTLEDKFSDENDSFDSENQKIAELLPSFSRILQKQALKSYGKSFTFNTTEPEVTPHKKKLIINKASEPSPDKTDTNLCEKPKLSKKIEKNDWKMKTPKIKSVGSQSPQSLNTHKSFGQSKHLSFITETLRT